MAQEPARAGAEAQVLRGGGGGPGELPWILTFGSGDNDWGAKACVGADGHITVIGALHGDLDFGGTALAPVGTGDVVLARLSPGGQVLWARTLGVGGYDLTDLAALVAVDGAGNVAVGVEFGAAFELDGLPVTHHGDADVAIALFDAQGGARWVQSFGGSGRDLDPNVAFALNGDVYFTAGFEDAVQFDGHSYSTSTERAFVVARLSAVDGSVVWLDDYGSDTGPAWAHAMAVDSAGDVAVTGDSEGTIDFGAGEIDTRGVFVAKLSGADGSQVWANGYPVAAMDASGCGLAFDAAGDLLAIGWLDSDLDLGGGSLSSVDGQDVWTARFDGGNGAHRWSWSFGGQGYEWACAVAAAGNGDAVIGGDYAHSIDLGTGLLSGAHHAFVARLAATDGSGVWSHDLGGDSAAEESVGGVAVTASDDVVLAGDFAAAFDFFELPVDGPEGGCDGFFASVPSGVLAGR